MDYQDASSPGPDHRQHRMKKVVNANNALGNMIPHRPEQGMYDPQQQQTMSNVLQDLDQEDYEIEQNPNYVNPPQYPQNQYPGQNLDYGAQQQHYPQQSPQKNSPLAPQYGQTYGQQKRIGHVSELEQSQQSPYRHQEQSISSPSVPQYMQSHLQQQQAQNLSPQLDTSQQMLIQNKIPGYSSPLQQQPVAQRRQIQKGQTTLPLSQQQPMQNFIQNKPTKNYSMGAPEPQQATPGLASLQMQEFNSHHTTAPMHAEPPVIKSKRPQNPKAAQGFWTKFKQQTLSGYYFLPSSKCVVICNAILGIFLILLGAIVLGVSGTVVEVDFRYDVVPSSTTSSGDVACALNSHCMRSVQIDKKMKKPVFVYLKMTNFYQNHRDYVKSYNRKQLQGDIINSNCDPKGKVNKVKDLKTYQMQNLNGVTLSENAVANPCGLRAKSMFTDTFELADSTGTAIEIKSTGIAWSVDINSKFKHNDDWKDTQWYDVEDERFMNWMSFSTTPNWKKLWGKIDQDLEPGKYTLTVDNTYDITDFDTEKIFSLSTNTFLGGTSNFLGGVLMFFGVVYFVLAMVILMLRWCKKIDDDKNYKELTFDWVKK